MSGPALAPTPEEIRDYLLRRMSEASRTRFEEAYFENDALLDRVEDEEDKLVSEFVLGKLEGSDRRRFEETLLDSPYYKDRVETTKRLNLHLGKHETLRRALPTSPGGRPPRNRAIPYVSAFLAALLFGAVAAALHLRSELEEARARVIAAAARPESPRRPGSPAVVVLGALPAGTGTEVRTLVRAPGADVVLVFPGTLFPASTQEVVVSVEPSGAPAWESGPLKRTSPSDDLSVRLPEGEAPTTGRRSVMVRTAPGGERLYDGVVEIVAPR
ncbi:MAG: hypothetical protein JNK60_10495 [Acidobacteria bacterium]|nr:hypothetical protein [Acidobacteriota bacterium]